MTNELSGGQIDISMVIPAYKAGTIIYKNLEKLCAVLDKSGKKYEVICVVDGIVDVTLEKAGDYAKRNRKVRVFSYKENRGKGYAVRYGLQKASGKIFGFVDAGSDLDYEDILELLRKMEKENADIVIGSKRHPKSLVNYSGFRKIFSLGYQFYVKSFFNLPVNDTQAGMKIFKKRVLDKILPLLKINGFAFDIEILSLAAKLLNAKIVEAPIHVSLDEKSSTISIKGGFIINSLQVFWDTLKIYYRLYISGFYAKEMAK